MSMSEMSIWVRDANNPCLPYHSTSHSFVALILSCSLKPLSFGKVKDGVVHLDKPGAAGGRVHGQVKVPPGCYIVVAYARCKNVFTNLAYVQVGCDQTVCVNLLPKRVSQCVGELVATIREAQQQGATNYSFASPPRKDVPEDVLEEAAHALGRLEEALGQDPFFDALPGGRDKFLDELK